MAFKQIFSVSRWLDDADVTSLLVTGQNGAVPSGNYQVIVKTSSSSVYIGGQGLLPGNEFPSGGISASAGYYGFPLVADKEYSLVVFEDPGASSETEETLVATTTDPNGAVISVLATPLI